MIPAKDAKRRGPGTQTLDQLVAHEGWRCGYVGCNRPMPRGRALFCSGDCADAARGGARHAPVSVVLPALPTETAPCATCERPTVRRDEDGVPWCLVCQADRKVA